MAKIIVSTDDGEVMEIIHTREYDLSKTIARADLLEEIVNAVNRAKRTEKPAEIK